MSIASALLLFRNGVRPRCVVPDSRLISPHFLITKLGPVAFKAWTIEFVNDERLLFLVSESTAARFGHLRCLT